MAKRLALLALLALLVPLLASSLVHTTPAAVAGITEQPRLVVFELFTPPDTASGGG
jgi:hypothetical protein